MRITRLYDRNVSRWLHYFEQNIFIESVGYQEFIIQVFFCSEYFSEGAERVKGGVNFNWSMK